MKIIQEWLRDFNTNDNDSVLAFAADNDGNVYVTGYSQVAMVAAAQFEELKETVTHILRKGVPALRPKENSDQPPTTAGMLGDTTVWLMKFTSSGALAWKKGLDLGVKDLSLTLTVDTDGDVILGSTSADRPAMLSKYGSRGNKRWSVELNPQPSTLQDITTDSEKNIFVVGTSGSEDAITHVILQYDSNSKAGEIIENAGAVDVISVDKEDNLIVAGRAPWGVFVGKIERGLNGTSEVWRRQLDAGKHEFVTAIACDDSNNVYIAGIIEDQITNPEIDAGTDAWLAKYSRDGQRQWLQQLTNTIGMDHASALVVDDGGYVYVAGHTTADLVAGKGIGEQDVWIGKYMPDGSNLWLYQHAITDGDSCHGLALDKRGNLYLSGITEPQGAFPNDGWVSRFREEPETSTELWSLMRAYVVGK